jgi:hypothetical protein
MVLPESRKTTEFRCVSRLDLAARYRAARVLLVVKLRLEGRMVLPMSVPSHITGKHDHCCTVLPFCCVFDFSKFARPPLIICIYVASRIFRALTVV